MTRIFKIVIEYWYYFYVALAITSMFYFRDWYFLLVVTVFGAGMISMVNLRWKSIDVIVLLAILYSLVSYTFSDYDISLYYYGIKGQLAIMFFYFIARGNIFGGTNFIKNFKWPMLIVIIGGILLYFFPPTWYVSYRFSSINAEEGSLGYYEAARMSSFFPHPYFLGYGSCLFILYMIKNVLIDREHRFNDYIFLFLAFITLFFAQIRVAIAYVLMFTFLLLFFRNRRIFIELIVGLIPVGMLFYYIINNIDTGLLNYILQRSTEHEGNIVYERFDLFNYFTKYISLFGYGLGRFGHQAYYEMGRGITDSEYLRVLCELGYVGGFLLFFPIFYAIYKGFRNLNLVFFETVAVAFFPFAMIGATPFESTSQHGYMMWFCIGTIISKTQKISLSTKIV